MVTATRALSLTGVRSQVLFIGLLAAGAIALGQDNGADFEGRIIGRIDFNPPEQPLPRPELEALLPFHENSPLHRADIRAALQKLYATGRFANIAMDASLETAPQAGEVTVTISTELNFFV